ncbi:helix-turn-helix domain-containing protein [Candidatus Clostridium radicumherbarum]|uniref:Helix-turn-helix domain-containing protein n=1 Tax=Candidatus Clostridium radicumherbarum TaxID=3381662 RepID=A0ABW8U109_9CLOT
MGKQVRELPTSLGDYIKSIRQIKGLRLTEVSEKSGISTSYLSRLENSKRVSPSQEILQKLSATLEVSFMSLLEISLYATNKDIKSLKDIILEEQYTIKGIEISQEARILLWDVVQYILDNNHRSGEISGIYIDGLIRRINLLNILL